MKRLLAFGALFLCSLLTFAQYSGSGSGTEDDPYLIYNENQLSQVSNFLNQEGVVFKLMKDLNLTNWIAENNSNQGWLPIGVETFPFKGKFYGNNHKISGFSITRNSESNVGFFGFIDGATVNNLTLEGTQVKGANNVGILIGQSTSSTISNITVKMTNSVSGIQYVGGFAGRLSQTTLTDCNSEVTGGISGTSYIGGMVGFITQTTNITNFSSKANVGGTDLVGGIVGQAEDGVFQNGTAIGNVSVTNGSVGGFAGKAKTYQLTDMFVAGNITAQGTDCRAGGMVAISEGATSFTNCTFKGDITGTQIVGGVVGELVVGSSQTFTSCFSKGKITNTGDYTGGILAVSHGACIAGMESCSHFGDISANSYAGGLIGAILSVSDEVPTLSTFTVKRSKDGNLLQTTKETIENGSYLSIPINNCVAIGNILGYSYVGGLIGSESSSFGYMPNARTTSCYDYYTKDLYKDGVYQRCTGDAYITYTHSYTRNIVSHAFTNNYYSGTIEGTQFVGGLTGKISGGSLTNNYVYANIIGVSNVGGIIGAFLLQEIDHTYATSTIKSNVSICSTLSATNSNLGRIYGFIESEDYIILGTLGSAEGNRALTQTKVILQGVVQEVEDDLQNGTSIGPSLLCLKATYVSMGWDFDNNWNNLETECYPYKKYQAAPPVIKSNLVSQATSISGQSLNGGTVYLYYKDRDVVSTVCDGYNWTFDTEPLQSGALVQIYADVEGMTPSYFTTTTVGYPGSGTEDDPYRIYTAEDLQGASNRGYYKLMNDIDLTSWINENSPTEGWPAIGRNSGEATYIDGDGHKVTGLWMNTTQNYNGLFSNFSAGQIKNLTVEVATGKKVKGGDYTGILIGRNANGRLVNCTVKGAVEGAGHVGGLVGYVENTTISAINADATIIGTSFVGGVAGQAMNCTMTTCNAATTITSSGADSKVGGLVGYAKGGSISKCTAQNNLTAADETNYVGGLVGYSETPICLSFSTGSVAATGSDSYSGGLVGYALSPIENCYSTANATGTLYTAGLVGYTFSTIDKCYAKGDVNGVMKGAGVVGQLYGSAASLTNSVACCNIISLTAQSSWGCRVIGGFSYGAAEPDYSNFALSTMQVSLNNVPQVKTDDNVEGIAKTAAELMTANTYMGIGWDFSEVWGIDEGQMYPYLLWEIDVNPVADISFDKTTLLLAVGKSETISASVLPLGATNKRLNWTSSNTAVATVADGVVTAVAIGTATITAISTDGSNISATCAVTVVANKDAAIAELQAIVDRAENLYNNSTEGENIGQYAAGSRAALLAVINSVKARISSTMSDEAITQCTNDINAAIAQFQSQQVTAGEDTDISQLANTIYIERVEAAPGGQLTLSVKMKNAVAAESFGFDLYLPDGVTVATDEDGFPLASLSTVRTTANKTNHFNADFKQDGALNIQAYSSRGYTISGNDGEVALITINITGTVEAGEYPIIIRNIAIADENSVTYRVDYVKSTLAISAYTLGDANSDGFIDVGDLTAISHYILERPDASFNANAADANTDNNIDVGDLTAVSHLILWGSVQRPTASRQITESKIDLTQQSNDVTDISTLDNVIYVEPFTVAANSTYTMSVKMKNTVVAEGFGFDLVLPEGITVATDQDGFPLASLSTERTTANKTNNFNADFKLDGTLNVQAYSSNGSSISGNDGEVAKIVLNIGANVAQGTYPIYIRNIAISDVNATSHRTDEVETAVTVTEASEYDVVLDEDNTAEFDDAENVNVLVKRTIVADVWNTIVLPFSMTAEQVTAAFGTGVKLADFSAWEVDGDNVKVTFTTDGITAIEANHPYLIKVPTGLTEFTVDGVDIAASRTSKGKLDEAYVEVKNGKKTGYFTGNYKVRDVPVNALFLSDNALWFCTGSNSIKAFRAYFELDGVEYTAGARLTFSVDDSGLTGITERSYNNSDSDRVFNLQGLPVTAPAKGIYIINGKKTIIK